uniref:Uncharacterized protein n=1 Tax=Chromera velia CCMP2878 TaxID=1169474 RepID=A0A0G4FQI3_9ALVE|eukprot:Cvel_452.t1-p1 / transcript=Cvel_452.t1 / gene=Cvel_452 / organism=Chromera_velia_CCMP2878 / gene_product=Probable ATP-dependent RNA helicase spindle-E, putative / transcript_product=Probable ATP-dependent RNA helicase spindle-E, putative / location=Cvel_scaffold14:155300-178114(-) / protein_length=3818 / sequence_SO=supercontig / SO=protein_coding / is_pseudo=false
MPGCYGLETFLEEQKLWSLVTYDGRKSLCLILDLCNLIPDLYIHYMANIQYGDAIALMGSDYHSFHQTLSNLVQTLTSTGSVTVVGVLANEEGPFFRQRDTHVWQQRAEEIFNEHGRLFAACKNPDDLADHLNEMDDKQLDALRESISDEQTAKKFAAAQRPNRETVGDLMEHGTPKVFPTRMWEQVIDSLSKLGVELVVAGPEGGEERVIREFYRRRFVRHDLYRDQLKHERTMIVSTDTNLLFYDEVWVGKFTWEEFESLVPNEERDRTKTSGPVRVNGLGAPARGGGDKGGFRVRVCGNMTLRQKMWDVMDLRDRNRWDYLPQSALEEIGFLCSDYFADNKEHLLMLNIFDPEVRKRYEKQLKKAREKAKQSQSHTDSTGGSAKEGGGGGRSHTQAEDMDDFREELAATLPRVTLMDCVNFWHRMDREGETWRWNEKELRCHCEDRSEESELVDPRHIYSLEAVAVYRMYVEQTSFGPALQKDRSRYNAPKNAMPEIEEDDDVAFETVKPFKPTKTREQIKSDAEWGADAEQEILRQNPHMKSRLEIEMAAFDKEWEDAKKKASKCSFNDGAGAYVHRQAGEGRAPLWVIGVLRMGRRYLTPHFECTNCSLVGQDGLLEKQFRPLRFLLGLLGGREMVWELGFGVAEKRGSGPGAFSQWWENSLGQKEGEDALNSEGAETFRAVAKKMKGSNGDDFYKTRCTMWDRFTILRNIAHSLIPSSYPITKVDFREDPITTIQNISPPRDDEEADKFRPERAAALALAGRLLIGMQAGSTVDPMLTVGEVEAALFTMYVKSREDFRLVHHALHQQACKEIKSLVWSPTVESHLLVARLDKILQTLSDVASLLNMEHANSLTPALTMSGPFLTLMWQRWHTRNGLLGEADLALLVNEKGVPNNLLPRVQQKMKYVFEGYQRWRRFVFGAFKKQLPWGDRRYRFERFLCSDKDLEDVCRDPRLFLKCPDKNWSPTPDQSPGKWEKGGEHRFERHRLCRPPPVPHYQVEATLSKGSMYAGVGSLPIADPDICLRVQNSVTKRQVTCITGKTGCGKSTMVPLLLLEAFNRLPESLRPRDAEGNLMPPKIIVTQPRRIAAISLAKRVCDLHARFSGKQERLGDVVGYRIGHDHVGGKNTKILFVTDGYLLQWIAHNPSHLNGVTHVVLDEVHERSLDSDLVCLMVKMLKQRAGEEDEHISKHRTLTLDLKRAQGAHQDLLKEMEQLQYTPQTKKINKLEKNISDMEVTIRRLQMDVAMAEPDAKRAQQQGLRVDHLRLVVMSATLQSGLYGTYFKALDNNDPGTVIQVGGHRYPLTYLFLDDLVDSNEHGIRFPRATHDLIKQYKKEFDNAVVRLQPQDFIDKVVTVKKGKKDVAHARPHEDAIKPDLGHRMERIFVSVLKSVAGIGRCILVFLPGADDILTFQQALEQVTQQWNRSSSDVIPELEVFALHSTVADADQERAIAALPQKCKVILATNIAESSITIPDVHWIFDFCLHKQVDLDQKSQISKLRLKWISQASCAQRAGRAGRLFPGTVLRFVSKKFWETLPEFEESAIKRVPLEHVVLKVRQTFEGKTVSDALSRSLEPPEELSIKQAVSTLAKQGALLYAHEAAPVTAFGDFAAHIGLSLSESRCLWMGLLLGIPADAALIAAALGVADPFKSPSPLFITDPLNLFTDLHKNLRARLFFDGNMKSEPIMWRNLLVAFLMCPQEHHTGKQGFNFHGLNSASYQRLKLCISTAKHLAMSTYLWLENEINSCKVKVTVPPDTLRRLEMLKSFQYPKCTREDRNKALENVKYLFLSNPIEATDARGNEKSPDMWTVLPDYSMKLPEPQGAASDTGGAVKKQKEWLGELSKLDPVTLLHSLVALAFAPNFVTGNARIIGSQNGKQVYENWMADAQVDQIDSVHIDNVPLHLQDVNKILKTFFMRSYDLPESGNPYRRKFALRPPREHEARWSDPFVKGWASNLERERQCVVEFRPPMVGMAERRKRQTHGEGKPDDLKPTALLISIDSKPYYAAVRDNLLPGYVGRFTEKGSDLSAEIKTMAHLGGMKFAWPLEGEGERPQRRRGEEDLDEAVNDESFFARRREEDKRKKLSQGFSGCPQVKSIAKYLWRALYQEIAIKPSVRSAVFNWIDFRVLDEQSGIFEDQPRIGVAAGFLNYDTEINPHEWDDRTGRYGSDRPSATCHANGMTVFSADDCFAECLILLSATKYQRAEAKLSVTREKAIFAGFSVDEMPFDFPGAGGDLDLLRLISKARGLLSEGFGLGKKPSKGPQRERGLKVLEMPVGEMVETILAIAKKAPKRNHDRGWHHRPFQADVFQALYWPVTSNAALAVKQKEKDSPPPAKRYDNQDICKDMTHKIIETDQRKYPYVPSFEIVTDEQLNLFRKDRKTRPDAEWHVGSAVALKEAPTIRGLSTPFERAWEAKVIEKLWQEVMQSVELRTPEKKYLPPVRLLWFVSKNLINQNERGDRSPGSYGVKGKDKNASSSSSSSSDPPAEYVTGCLFDDVSQQAGGRRTIPPEDQELDYEMSYTLEDLIERIGYKSVQTYRNKKHRVAEYVAQHQAEMIIFCTEEFTQEKVSKKRTNSIFRVYTHIKTPKLPAGTLWCAGERQASDFERSWNDVLMYIERFLQAHSVGDMRVYTGWTQVRCEWSNTPVVQAEVDGVWHQEGAPKERKVVELSDEEEAADPWSIVDKAWKAAADSKDAKVEERNARRDANWQANELKERKGVPLHKEFEGEWGVHRLSLHLTKKYKILMETGVPRELFAQDPQNQAHGIQIRQTHHVVGYFCWPEEEVVCFRVCLVYPGKEIAVQAMALAQELDYMNSRAYVTVANNVAKDGKVEAAVYEPRWTKRVAERAASEEEAVCRAMNAMLMFMKDRQKKEKLGAGGRKEGDEFEGLTNYEPEDCGQLTGNVYTLLDARDEELDLLNKNFTKFMAGEDQVIKEALGCEFQIFGIMTPATPKLGELYFNHWSWSVDVESFGEKGPQRWVADRTIKELEEYSRRLSSALASREYAAVACVGQKGVKVDKKLPPEQQKKMREDAEIICVVVISFGIMHPIIRVEKKFKRAEKATKRVIKKIRKSEVTANVDREFRDEFRDKDGRHMKLRQIKDLRPDFIDLCCAFKVIKAALEEAHKECYFLNDERLLESRQQDAIMGRIKDSKEKEVDERLQVEESVFFTFLQAVELAKLLSIREKLEITTDSRTEDIREEGNYRFFGLTGPKNIEEAAEFEKEGGMAKHNFRNYWRLEEMALDIRDSELEESIRELFNLAQKYTLLICLGGEVVSFRVTKGDVWMIEAGRSRKAGKVVAPNETSHVVHIRVAGANPGGMLENAIDEAKRTIERRYGGKNSEVRKRQDDCSVSVSSLSYDDYRTKSEKQKERGMVIWYPWEMAKNHSSTHDTMDTPRGAGEVDGEGRKKKYKFDEQEDERSSGAETEIATETNTQVKKAMAAAAAAAAAPAYVPTPEARRARVPKPDGGDDSDWDDADRAPPFRGFPSPSPLALTKSPEQLKREAQLARRERDQRKSEGVRASFCNKSRTQVEQEERMRNEQEEMMRNEREKKFLEEQTDSSSSSSSSSNEDLTNPRKIAGAKLACWGTGARDSYRKERSEKQGNRTPLKGPKQHRTPLGAHRLPTGGMRGGDWRENWPSTPIDGHSGGSGGDGWVGGPNIGHVPGGLSLRETRERVAAATAEWGGTGVPFSSSGAAGSRDRVWDDGCGAGTGGGGGGGEFGQVGGRGFGVYQSAESSQRNGRQLSEEQRQLQRLRDQELFDQIPQYGTVSGGVNHGRDRREEQRGSWGRGGQQRDGGGQRSPPPPHPEEDPPR